MSSPGARSSANESPDLNSDESNASYHAHWEQVWETGDPTAKGWYQPTPEPSLSIIESKASRHQSIIDIGAGTSVLADSLVERGYTDLTVLDISEAALRLTKHRLGDHVHYFNCNVLDFSTPKLFRLWHDRATFHFLVDPSRQRKYLQVMNDHLRPGGMAILGTFSIGGWSSCSGLDVKQHNAQTIAKRLAEAGVKASVVSLMQTEHLRPDGQTQPFSWTQITKPAEVVHGSSS